MAKPETLKRVLDKYQYENVLGIKSALKQNHLPLKAWKKSMCFYLLPIKNT